MSTIYSYYIGYKHGQKVYLLGPYDCFQKPRPVISRSNSFASDLKNSFWPLDINTCDQNLQTIATDGYLGIMSINELPSGSPYKRGYFLIQDVIQYEASGGERQDGMFWNTIPPTVYAAIAEHEARFGRKEPDADEEGNKVPTYNASDYMYYAFEDKECEEYEAEKLRSAADILTSYNSNIPKDAEIVVIQIIS